MRKISRELALLVLIACVLTTSAVGQKKVKKARPDSAKKVDLSKPTVWQDPGQIERLDLFNGEGGAKNAPRPPFTFVEEDKGGTNPKVKVTDAAGRHWGVKWGPEVHSEVFASRLVWAVGYYVEPNYFVSSGKIEGVKDLSRAKKYVSRDGSFSDARFELKEKHIDKKTDKESWRWDANPFVGTRELNGLKIMIMLTSNWDPKDQADTESNTAIFTNKKTGRVTYVMSDWGATMGKWGGFFSREKWDCDGYGSQTRKFVTGVDGPFVRFGYDGKHASKMKDSIRVTDVRWLLLYLGRISDAQIRNALNAAGASPEEVSCFTRALRERIQQLRRVATP